MTTLSSSTSSSSSKKIDKLTPEQIQLMHHHREQYIDFIVNNKKYYDPLFSNQVKLHIYRQVNPFKVDVDWIYKKSGLKQSPLFIFEADSYLQEKMMVSYIRTYTNLEDDSAVEEIKNTFGNDHFPEGGVRKESWNQIFDNMANKYEHVPKFWNDLDENRKSMLDIQTQVTDDFIQKNNENKEINDVIKKHYEIFDSVDARQQVARQLFAFLSMGGENPPTSTCEQRYLLDKMRLLLDKKDLERPQAEERKLEFVEQGFGLPWNSWMAFYSYFSRINVLKNADFDRFFAFFLNNKIWSIQFYKHWVCFTRLPNRIYRDALNRLHSTDGSCVEWRRPQDVNYFIHGIPINEPGLWERAVTDKISTKEVLAISNMELRNAIMSVISPGRLIRETNAELVDEYKTRPRKNMDKYTKNTEKKMIFQSIKLYRLNPSEIGLNNNGNNTNRHIFVLFYNDPSTGREYFSYPDPTKATDAVTAMAAKFGLSKKDYLEKIVAET